MTTPVDSIREEDAPPNCRSNQEEEVRPSSQTEVSPTSSSSSSSGRVKENVCGDQTLRESAMSASSLLALSFVELPPGFSQRSSSSSRNSHCRDPPLPPPSSSSSTTRPFSETAATDAMYVSSSSSTCTRESDAGTSSDVDSGVPTTMTTTRMTTTPQLDRTTSDKLNAKISSRKTSRQGRSTQRWVQESTTTSTTTCSSTNSNSSNSRIRLVTGCVPILRGGKILFVSARGKPEWILPKGGWEQDETMQESAVRECFEEAGVLGILGPPLQPVEYETRKAKKRRLEQEQQQQQQIRQQEQQQQQEEIKTNHESTTTQMDNTAEPLHSTCDGSDSHDIATISSKRRRIEGDTTSSSTNEPSSSSSYCKVRMTLFPLYVSQVWEKWPEDGRFRTAVDLDQAIQLLDRRPEFQQVLKQVKSRGLHHLLVSSSSPPTTTNTTSSSSHHNHSNKDGTETADSETPVVIESS